MPRLVDLGPPYGVTSFPDDATDEHIVSQYDQLEAERNRLSRRAAIITQSAANQVEKNQQSNIGQNIALGVESGKASAPIAVGELMRTAAPLLPDREGPATGVGGVPIPGFNRPFVSELGKALSGFGRRRQEETADTAEAIGGGVSGDVARSLAETAVTSAQTLPFAVVGLTPAAIAAAAQQYGLSKSQFRNQLLDLNPGLSEEEANAAAEKPAAISGAMTGALTRTFGGTERFIDQIVSGKLKVGGIKQLLGAAARSAYLEFPEELLDQAAQGYAEKAYVNPAKTHAEIWNDAVMAGGAGALLGFGTPAAIGGVGLGADAATERITRPSRMRQGAENRRAAISGMVARGEIPSIQPGEPQYAQSPGVTPAPPSQEAPPGQEAAERLRLRNPPEDRVEAQAGEVAPPAPVPQPEQVLESRVPQQRIPIQIKQADGTTVEGEFNGYYDMTEIGRGVMMSIGKKLPNGQMTHTMLAPSEQVIGTVPTFDQWNASRQQESRVGAPPATPLTVAQVSARLAELGATPESVVVTSEPDVPWDGRAVFRDGQLQRIEINAANISSPEQVSSTLEHEAAHAAVVSGQVKNVLGTLESAERDAILADMGRLGYTIGDKAEFDARGVDALAQAWKGRNWFERLVGTIAEIASRIGIPMTRLGAERAAARAAGMAMKTALATPAQFGVGEQAFESKVDRPRSPLDFRTRTQVIETAANPGLTPSQQNEVEELASVQAGMVSDQLAGRLMASPVDEADVVFHDWLDYLLNRKFLSQLNTQYASLPSFTPEQRRFREIAGATILGHYGVDRGVRRQMAAELEADGNSMTMAFTKLAKRNTLKLKANFMEAMFKHLPADYKTYLANRTKLAPAAQNTEAQWKARLVSAERALNEHEQSPTALQRALQAIAVTIPDALLNNPATTNQDIVNWAQSNGILQTIVSQSVMDWILSDDGSGSPALLGYNRLIKDLKLLKDITANEAAINKEIKDFETWFRASGKAGTVSAKNFAESYFKFRQGRDRAMEVVKTFDRDIERLDARIRGTTSALTALDELMRSPQYVSTVRQAAREADVVVRALHESGQSTGLIDRDTTVGRWKAQVPGGNEYVIDLHPNAAQEHDNRAKLGAFIIEARDYAKSNGTTNPLLADEYERLADYLETHFLHPSFNPESGFIQRPFIQIPGTTKRIGMDPFQGFLSFTGPLFQITKAPIERVGGRVMRQLALDANALDTVMKKVERINASSDYGYVVMTFSILKALESHGWNRDMMNEWDQHVAEPVIAASQNNVSPSYSVGDVIVGSGVRYTTEDRVAIRMMKQWSDAILQAAPAHIKDQLADLGIIRKAIGAGLNTMARVAAPWTRPFTLGWADATTPAAKWALLSKPEIFRKVILGFIAEYNPEFSKMNPASPDKSPLFQVYRHLANTEKSGVQSFSNIDEVVQFLSNEMVSRNMAPDYATAKDTVERTLLQEVTEFIDQFQRNVINYKSTQVYGGVPPAIVQTATANNSFTMPRGTLQAPSTFYSYSPAIQGKRLSHVSSLRSLMNLKVLQSAKEAQAAMEKAKRDMEDKMDEYQRAGMSKSKARAKVIKESAAERKNKQIRLDYLDLNTVLSAMEKAFANMERFESSSADHYEHSGVVFLNNAFSTLKSFLLSSVQAVATNFFSGTLLGPAIQHLQTGQMLKAINDISLKGLHRMAQVTVRKVSDVFANNKQMSKLLRMHAPLWNGLARGILEAQDNWQKMQMHAQMSGIVTPYNLRKTWKNQAALKATAGNLEEAGENWAMSGLNAALSAPGIRHFIEFHKFAFPRLFDNAVNYTLLLAFEKETEFLKRMGSIAFKNREAAAARTGANWKDITQPGNILTPEDLGLSSKKALQRYQDMFVGVGSLDKVILDYYERTKGMTPEQQENEPLLSKADEYTGVLLQYAAISNVATETTRSHWFRGRGTEGVWRNIAGTFWGWATNMIYQLSKAMETHSGDPQRIRIWRQMLVIATSIMVFALVGAFNWEAGDLAKEWAYKEESARMQLGNIEDVVDGLKYFTQALVNTVPVFGNMVGSLAGIAYTGRSNPFDLTSLIPQAGFMAGLYNAGKRAVQTGDVKLPLLDFVRQFIPGSKAVLNRVPEVRGMVDQQNAVRVMNASAPRGTEIKWGQSRGGEVRYGPAHDELVRLIASAYEASAHGGSVENVQQRYAEAIAAFEATGLSHEEATKRVATALSAKEPIRVLTGREMTPEEEQRWVKRMTPEQKAVYDRATQAWALLGNVTGKDLGMVAEPGGGGGGGGGSIGGVGRAPVFRTGRLMRAPSAGSGFSAPSYSFAASVPRGTSGRRRGSRMRRASLGRRTRAGRTPRLRRSRVLRSGLTSRRRMV